MLIMRRVRLASAGVGVGVVEGICGGPLSCLFLGYKMNACSIRGTRGSADLTD